jgi:hypothetical protein
MSRGGNHYSRLHFCRRGDARAACGRESATLRVTPDLDVWQRRGTAASGDLCAACRASVRKLEDKS